MLPAETVNEGKLSAWKLVQVVSPAVFEYGRSWEMAWFFTPILSNRLIEQQHFRYRRAHNVARKNI